MITAVGKKLKKLAYGSLSQFFYKRRTMFLLITSLFLFLFIYATSAHGQAAPATPGAGKFDWLSCASNGFSCIITGIVYVISAIGDLLIAFGAWVTTAALSFSQNVINLAAVQIGFGVSLSLANMGFVLGIIIIALATILHRQTYGLKQLLSRLIFMAILVNFSLVIAGTILNFSDQLTNFFINQASPTMGTNFWAFTGLITKAFAPQQLLTPMLAPGVTNEMYNAALSGCKSNLPTFEKALIAIGWDSQSEGESRCAVNSANAGAQANSGYSDFGQFLAGVLNAVFVIIFTFTIAFTFLALGILLLVRYLYLAILLILAPLAWLTWVFPQFSHLSKSWWDKFLKWTFFAPIVVFFLYLAIMTAGQKPLYDSLALSTQGSAVYLTKNAGIVSTVLTKAAEMLLVLGLAIGGLFAADKLSIIGASTATKVAKVIGGAAAGWTGKQGAKGGRALYQRAGGERLTAAMQKSRIPGIAPLGRGLATVTERVGRGYVEQAEKKAPEDTKRLVTELQGFGALDNEKKFAWLKKLDGKGKLLEAQKVGGQSLAAFLSDDKLVEQYKMGGWRDDVEKKYGLTKEVRDAHVELENAQESRDPARIATAQSRLKEEQKLAMEKMTDAGSLATFMKSDEEIEKMAKDKEMPMNLSPEAFRVMRDAVAEGAGKVLSPQAFSALMSKFDRFDSLDTFTNLLKTKVDKVQRDGGDPVRELFSERILNWIDNSPAAQNFGMTRKDIGLPEKPKEETGKQKRAGFLT